MAEQSEPQAATTGSRVPAAVRAVAGSAWSGARASWRFGRAGAERITRFGRAVARNRRVRRLSIAMAILTVSLVGVVGGVLLGARTTADVGPFRAQLSITPSLTGDTNIAIPPLGAITLNSHDGPAHVAIRLGTLNQAKSEALLKDPNGFAVATKTVVADVTRGVVQLALRTLGSAVLGAMVLAALVFRNIRRVAWAGGLSLAVTAGSFGAAAATFHPTSIAEPRYEGLLINAPAVVGDAQAIANRYEAYSAQLQQLVVNVSRLYGVVSAVPAYAPDPNTIKVLHISDMHLNPSAWSVVRTLVQQFNIEVVIDTGDLVDWGSGPEASYAAAIGTLGVPYVFIRGNHDSGATAAAVARQHGAIVLENSVKTVAGLTIAGIGDPRFTPDKETSPHGSGDTDATHHLVHASGEQLAATIRHYGHPVDIALVHDPASTDALAGTCPLVLAGHLHQRSTFNLPRPADAPADAANTTVMVEGSTGGAGLRGLEQAQPLPLEMSVLYFNKDKALQAYDNITVGGTGLQQVSLERHLFKPAHVENTSSSPSLPTSPSPGR
jgi:predicted MPP superfamily phosphohydrolase